MTLEQIETRVFSVVAKKLGLPTSALKRDSSFQSLSLDSVEAFDILFCFEQEFSVSASDESIWQMSTLGEMIEILYELQEEKT